MSIPKLIVTLDKTASGKFAETVAKLKSAGLAVEEELKTLGMVVGRADGKTVAAQRKNRESIAKVEGVRGVESESTESIAPPGSSVE